MNSFNLPEKTISSLQSSSLKKVSPFSGVQLVKDETNINNLKSFSFYDKQNVKSTSYRDEQTGNKIFTNFLNNNIYDEMKQIYETIFNRLKSYSIYDKKIISFIKSFDSTKDTSKNAINFFGLKTEVNETNIDELWNIAHIKLDSAFLGYDDSSVKSKYISKMRLFGFINPECGKFEIFLIDPFHLVMPDKNQGANEINENKNNKTCHSQIFSNLITNNY